MGPNDAELIRVFTQDVGGTIADDTFPTNADFQVVVEVEAGSAIFGSGAKYAANVVVRDVTANANIPVTPAAGFSGSMSDANFSTATNRFVYTVKKADLGSGKDNHICQVLAYLSVGVTNPDTSFGESALFMLTSP